MPKLSQLLVDGDLLAGWLKGGCLRTVPVGNHLPDDAALFGVYNAHPGVIGLVFTSEGFPEVAADGNPAMLPVLRPILFRAAPPAGSLPYSRN